MESTTQNTSLNLSTIESTKESADLLSVDDVYKTMKKSFTKLKTTVNKETQFLESTKQLRETDSYKKVVEEKQKKLDEKVEDMNFKDKTKIDNWNRMIEQSRRATEKKIAAIQLKRQSLKDQLVKLELEEQSITTNFEDYKKGCEEQIEQIYEKNGKKSKLLEDKKEILPPVSLAEEKKTIQYETEKKQIAASLDSTAALYLEAMKKNKESLQRDYFNNLREEEERERIRKYDEHQEFKRNQEIERERRDREREQLENDCETIEERQKYLAGIKWLKTKALPDWFQTKCKSLLETKKAKMEQQSESSQPKIILNTKRRKNT